MGLWRTLSIRFRAAFDRKALNRELDDEVRFHIQQETQANLARGMSPQEAARRARFHFGGEQRVKEEWRAVRGESLVESTLQDARFGLRMLSRNPGFTFIAAATLALGLGANTAMFSVINAVLLRPLPFADPDRLVRIIDSNPSKGFPRFSSSPSNFLDWRAEAHSFAGMAASTAGTLTLSGNGDAARLHALFVTPEMFAVLGVPTVAGRAFTTEEGTYGHGKVAVLSFHLWQQRFGGDSTILGRIIKLDGENYLVIGVAAPEFRLNNNDVIVPLDFGPHVETQRGAHYLAVYARLQPGVTLQHANEEMRTIAARLAAAYPDKDSGWTAFAMQMHEFVVGRVRPAMLILLSAVGLLALIACANVANLLLSRAVDRQREISVRAALGATRARMVRQLLIESFTLYTVGASLGLAVAAGAIRLLRTMGPITIPRLASVELDVSVLAFTAGLTVLTTALVQTRANGEIG